MQYNLNTSKNSPLGLSFLPLELWKDHRCVKKKTRRIAKFIVFVLLIQQCISTQLKFMNTLCIKYKKYLHLMQKVILWWIISGLWLFQFLALLSMWVEMYRFLVIAYILAAVVFLPTFSYHISNMQGHMNFFLQKVHCDLTHVCVIAWENTLITLPQ